MFARYYNSATGRFLSPDWDAKSDDPVPYAKLDNPQSLNLYSYVLNNPVTTEDPNGHCAEAISCSIEFGLGGSSLGPVGTGVGIVVGAGIGLYIEYKVAQAVENSIQESKGEQNGGKAAPVDGTKSPPNPHGSPGAPDHQAGVADEVDAARGRAKPGEQVLSNKPVQGHDSTRRPDVQIVGTDGRTREIVEVERHPTRARNQKREAEYTRLGIPHTTKPIKPKKTDPSNE